LTLNIFYLFLFIKTTSIGMMYCT